MMFRQRPSLSIALMFGIILIASEVASGQVKPVTSDVLQACQGLSEQAARLKDEAQRLGDLNGILDRLVAGTAVPDAPLNALFSIDVRQQDAVEKRRRELQESLADGGLRVHVNIEAPFVATCPDDAKVVANLALAVSAAREKNARAKIAFFKQPPDVRTSLVSQQDLIGDLKQTQKQLASEIEAQKLAKAKAKQDQESAANDVEILVDMNLKELAAARTQLAASKGELATYHETWLGKVHGIVDLQKSAAEQVAQLSARNMASPTLAEQLDLYLQIVPLWRRLTDEGLFVFNLAYSAEDVPRLPPKPSALLKELANSDAGKDYEASYGEAESRLAQFTADFKNESRALADKQYHIQDQAALLRAQVYQNVKDSDALSKAMPPDQVFLDYLREVRAVPYRVLGLLYTKYTSYKADFSGGVNGWISVAGDGGTILLVLLVPLGAFLLFRRTIKLLDRVRVRLAKKRSQRFNIALWLHHLTPYLPWVTSLAAIWLTQELLSATSLQELGAIFTIASYFIYYRVFRIAVRDVFNALRLRLEMVRDEQANVLVDGTAVLVGRFFLTVAIILYCADLAVGQVLVYGLVRSITQFFGVIIVAIACNRWNFLIEPLAKDVLPPAFASRIQRLCRGRSGYVFCLPSLVLLLVYLLLLRVMAFIGGFDVSKRFAAKIYRRRVEALKSERGVEEVASVPSIPAHYRKLFAVDGLENLDMWATGNDQELAAVRHEIDDWLSSKSAEPSTAIHGEKGTGKTTILQRVREEYADKTNVIVIRVPPKTTTVDACRRLIAKALGIEDANNLSAEILAKDACEPKRKTLILIDEAHNLFLGTVGGFAAYLELVGLMNAETHSTFWCLAFNEHAWTFLQGYFAHNQHIRSSIYLSPWSDTEIAELVMKRHRSSGIRLIFDQAILAAQSNSADDANAYAERQFFRILWEQAKGNPRVAMRFWLTAVTPRNARTFRVSLPIEPNTKVLDRLSDDACFVYSAIARHENLARMEIVQVLNLSLAPVSLALKFGVETGLISVGDDGRYRLNPEWHNYVVAHLKRKNFLYGLD